MKRFIVLTFIAIFAATMSYAQENIFIINGKKVENFDGSQLSGKKILSFRINKTGNGEIYTIHTDELLPDSLKNRIVQVTTNVYEIKKGMQADAEKSAKDGKTEVHVDVLSTKPLIILDGEEYNGSFNDIKPEDIKSVNVYKAGNEVANAYGEKGKNGVIKIFTKASEDSISYIINGKPASSKEMKEISSSNISSVVVLKRGSEAALNHGEIGKTHNIVIIKTK